MLSPWHVGAEELFPFRGSGGQRFTELLNALLRADLARGGGTPADAKTNIRVNIGDEGVDAEVKVPLDGYLEVKTPSAWQFKATDFGSVTEAVLREEASKPEAKRLIEAGSTYFVCVCDDWPSVRVREREEVLEAIVREINPAAPAPRVLGASQLADWASRFTSIVVAFFRPHLDGALSFDAWVRRERAELPRFVDIASRAEASKLLSDHASATSSSPVLSVMGPSGAGASRLVLEAVAPTGALVVYTPDEVAGLRLATSLVNQPTAAAVLVVDHCSLDGRFKLEQMLLAEGHRVRAIVLCDPTEGAARGSVALRRLGDQDVQGVIDANFSGAPSSHRRAFVHLADGILKIAARLATSYAAGRSTFLDDSAAWAVDELHRLVRDREDLRALQALALFKRIGFRGDVAAQIAEVCEVLRLDPADTVARCRRLEASPGVVSLGPRYISVRPRLFAQPLFEAAWEEHLAPDAAAFIDALSTPLRASLLRQAGQVAPKQVREWLGEWSVATIRELEPADLTRPDSVEPLLALVDILPIRVAPLFTDLITRMTDEEARAPGGVFSHWPARMHLTWALKDLIAYRETYALAEAALFRLACAEPEPEVAAARSASATETWGASFQPLLSGTEVSFRERLNVLASKLTTQGPAAAPLVLVALGFALAGSAHKVEGAPMVSGKVRPPDWQPTTYAELWDGLDAGISVLGQCLTYDAHRDAGVRVLGRHGRALLQRGRGDALRGVVDKATLSDEQRNVVFGFVDDFLTFAVQPEAPASDGYPKEYLAAVNAWRETLETTDLMGRIARAVSARSLRRHSDERAWEQELDDLAAELYETPAGFERALTVLHTGERHGGAVLLFGRGLGQRDKTAALLTDVIASAATAPSPFFARGYLWGLRGFGEAHDGAVGAALERLENDNPGMAVDLNEMTSAAGSPLVRALRLVRERRLPTDVLGQSLRFTSEPELLAAALELVLEVSADHPEDAASTCLKILLAWAWTPGTVLPADTRTVSAVWRVLELAIDGAGAESHSWAPLLRRLSESDLERAVRLVCTATVRGDFSIRDDAAKELSMYITRDPSLVLKVLGPMLLEPDGAMRFSIGRSASVLNALPYDLLTEWIVTHGVTAARVVATHLPPPYVDTEGTPVVPPLTEFVLQRFGDDQRVVSSFSAGRHSFQMYSGDIAGQHEREAAIAERFLAHAIRGIREWAALEAQSSRRSAQRWLERDEEDLDE